MQYGADGTILQRKYLKDGVQISKRDYLRGKELKNNILESVYHNDGRAIKSGSNWKYEYHIKDHLSNVRVTFEDMNANGIVTSNEIKSRNDYYSFGMEWNNRWELSDTISPENGYRYNGKGYVEEMGLKLLDFANRNFDPVLGRFWTVDNWASKYPAWAPYNYAMNSPIRFIDKDGNGPLDIIIQGTKDDQGDKFRIQTFNALKSLTDDKLKLNKDGTVSIVEKGEGSKTHGTELIRNLVEGKTADGKSFDVILTNDSKGTEVNTQNNAEAFANVIQNASNGAGTGTKIVISPDLNTKLPMKDGTRENVPYNIALGHEMIHADHFRLGKREIKINELPGIKNKEELNTIKRENILRKENGLNLRYDGAFIKK